MLQNTREKIVITKITNNLQSLTSEWSWQGLIKVLVGPQHFLILAKGIFIVVVVNPFLLGEALKLKMIFTDP